MVRIAKHSRLYCLASSLFLRVSAYSGVVLLLFFLLYYVYGGLLPFVVLLFAISGILYNAEDKILYDPETPSYSRLFVPVPNMYGMPYENIRISSEDGTVIHMFLIKQPEERFSSAPTILFFHGNAGNIGQRLPNILCLYTRLHCNVLIVEYRGYGMSEGSPSEAGFYMDARASLSYLHSRLDINRNEIIAFGRSLGGAVAIDLASRADCAEKIWCLIVENTFTSIPDMGKHFISKFLGYLPLFAYKNKYLSSYKISSMRVPALFLSGMDDALVPPWMMSELYTRCGSEKKQLVQIPNGAHNDTWTVPGYFDSMSLFLHALRNQEAIASRDVSVPMPFDRHWLKVHDV